MDIIIVKIGRNDMYWDNVPCIAFRLKGNVINVEESGWSVCENFCLGSEPPRSSATLVKRFCDILFFQRVIG